MADPRFELYYWPIPFRAQAARYILTHAGESWSEPDSDAVMALYQDDLSTQPTPFMGPPILHDREAGLWLSQLPALLCGPLSTTHCPRGWER